MQILNFTGKKLEGRKIYKAKKNENNYRGK